MSKPSPPRGIDVPSPPPRGFDAMMEIAAEAQLDRIASMSDEELAVEMRRMGFDPDKPLDTGELLAKVPRAVRTADAPRVVSLTSRRRTVRVIEWAAAACLAAAVFAFILPRALRDGRGRDTLAQHDAAPPPTTTGSSETPVLVRVAQLRDEAERACDQELWSACEQRLDAAKALDPAGERQSRVQILRRAIEGAKWRKEHVPPGDPRFYQSKP